MVQCLSNLRKPELETSMTKLHATLDTNLDREAAFAYIADWSKQAEWDPQNHILHLNTTLTINNKTSSDKVY